MESTPMRLKILLPHQIFLESADVLRIVAETRQGSFGILPARLDCIAALIPGILTCETTEEGEFYVAVDEGVLVKTGKEVLISVRNAFKGADLGNLRETIEKEFMTLDEREKNVRTVLAKMEGEFLRRLMGYRHE